MARYDYRCSACGKVFEVEHGMMEHPDVVCPDCGAAATKVFSASGIEFKGSGFYNTDQRGGSSATSATSGSDSSSAASGSAGNGSSASASQASASGHTCENCPHKDK